MRYENLEIQLRWKILSFNLNLRFVSGVMISLFCWQTLVFADDSEMHGMSSARMEILKVIQTRTNKELKSHSELTVKSWTSTNDYVLVVAKPQTSMFHDRIVFALLKKDAHAKKPVSWKIINYKVTGLNQSPLKSWEKKYKILPKDLFMLAQIAIQVDD